MKKEHKWIQFVKKEKEKKKKKRHENINNKTAKTIHNSYEHTV